MGYIELRYREVRASLERIAFELEDPWIDYRRRDVLERDYAKLKAEAATLKKDALDA